jgi:hypothetical protein
MDAFWNVGVGFLSGILSEKFVNVKMLVGESVFVTSVFGVVWCFLSGVIVFWIP